MLTYFIGDAFYIFCVYNSTRFMMTLLKWESRILNHIYKTDQFSKIVLENGRVEDINYQRIYGQVQKVVDFKTQHTYCKDLTECAQVICQPKLHSNNIRESILKMEQIIKEGQICEFLQLSNKQNISEDLQKSPQKGHLPYSIDHVIIYSCLSKCRIWPKMLKHAFSLVPNLVSFYNKFTQDFHYDLSYKFDPVILTHKYERVMNRIEIQKKSFPELFIALKENDLQFLQQLLKTKDAFREKTAENSQPGLLQMTKNQKMQPWQIEGKNQTLQIQKKIPSYMHLFDFLSECKYEDKYLTHYAVQNSSLEVVKLLHEAGFDFELMDNEQQTPVFYAVKRDSFEILKFLVETVKVNINHEQYQSRTPIYLAAFEGNLKVVDYLYSKGANPEMESKLSRTPLSKACYLGNVSVAEYLIKIGVNLTTIDSKGRTALHNAAWGIQGGRDGKKRGPLLLEDSPECVKLLLDSGHPIEFEDFDGFTPLFSAVASYAIKSVRILVEYGANMKHKTKMGEDVVFVASKFGHLGSLKLLIQEFNCGYLQKNNKGYEAIHASFSIDNPGVCYYLLDLYYKNNNPLRFFVFIDCLAEFSKQEHLRYFTEWVGEDEKKREFIYENLLSQLEGQTVKAESTQHQQKEEGSDFISTMFSKQNSKFAEFFLKMIKQLDFLSRLPRQVFQRIISSASSLYVSGHLKILPEYLTEISPLLIDRDIKFENFEIDSQSNEDQIIKLLHLESSMTENLEALHRLILFLVKRRMTKVLLWLFTVDEHRPNHSSKWHGAYRFSKQEILQAMHYSPHEKAADKEQSEEKMSILEYCHVNGLYDVLKVIENSSTENFKLKVRIPEYSYSFHIQHTEEFKPILFPVPTEYFDFKYLLSSHLNPDQSEYFTNSFKLYSPETQSEMEKSIQMIDSLEGLELMQQYLDGCGIMGVDIEHYSTSSEQFICLVQLSGKGRTFLIDGLVPHREQIAAILKGLMRDRQRIKLFHSYDQDLKWLNEDFKVSEFQAIIDTSKFYGILNPKQKSPSLKLLTQMTLNQVISKNFQRSDWRIRPLFKEMMCYAAADAYLLPFIYLKQLMEAGNEINNPKDQEFFHSVKKVFGVKQHVKSKGRYNVINFDPKNE